MQFLRSIPLLLCVGTAAVAQQPAAPCTARALLIGIGDYQSPAMQDLGGPRNDVATMRHLLTSRFGFAEQNITTLLDAEATRARILAALRKAVQETAPQDVLYIHYSGHGSQVPDLNGDEDDGRDETLVPYDGRTPGVADIVDDELDAILAGLRSDRVVIVLDACHSGTGTRAGGGMVCHKREVPPEDGARLQLYQHLRLRERGVTRAEDRYVLMTGAAPHQTALDGPVGGRIHGFFTYALAEALGNAAPGATASEVFAAAARQHRAIQQSYHLIDLRAAQLEAPRARAAQPLLPILPNASRRAWLAVRTTGRPQEVVLADGATLGAAVGSHWAIYPAGDAQLLPGRAIATGVVYENTGNNAWLRLDWRRDPQGSLDGCRAVALTPAGERGLPVRIEGGSSAEQERVRQRLRQAVAGIEFVGKERLAQFTVELRPVANRILGVDGLEVIQSVPATTEGTASMARLIARSVMSSELLSLANPGTRLRLEVGIAGSTPAATQAPRRSRGIKLVGSSGGHALHIRAANEPRSAQNSLVLELRAEQDCYVTVVDVDSEGKVNVLFPNPISAQRGFLPDGRLTAHQSVRIPDHLGDDNRAQFWFDYADPAGMDTVRVFASTNLATAEVIRTAMRNLADAPRVLGDDAGTAQDPRQQLIAELKLKLAGVMARGIKVVPNRPQAGPGRPQPSPARTSLNGTGQATPPNQDTGAQPGTGDWTATSLTIRIDPK
ncbi:MAG: caspase family protein [Planctomycetes bacterium]|nr:caspase family protein [Planctomycetota bacterium]